MTKARWSLSPLPLSWLYTWWPARRWKAFRTRRKRNAQLEPARCLRRTLDRWFCPTHPWWRYLARRLSLLAWISRPGNIPCRNVGSEWPVISFVVLKSSYSEISLIWNCLNSTHAHVYVYTHVRAPRFNAYIYSYASIAICLCYASNAIDTRAIHYSFI